MAQPITIEGVTVIEHRFNPYLQNALLCILKLIGLYILSRIISTEETKEIKRNLLSL